eukprot:2740525-Pyramimonas_sp.AAC.2
MAPQVPERKDGAPGARAPGPPRRGRRGGSGLKRNWPAPRPTAGRPPPPKAPPESRLVRRENIPAHRVQPTGSVMRIYPCILRPIGPS